MTTLPERPRPPTPPPERLVHDSGIGCGAAVLLIFAIGIALHGAWRCLQ